MIIINVYTNKKFAGLKNAIGIVEVIDSGVSYNISPIVMNGPISVSDANYVLTLAAIRALNNISDVVVFKTNKNMLAKDLEVNNSKWVNNTESMDLNVLRQTIEDKQIKFSTEQIDDVTLNNYIKVLEESKQILKHGMELITESSPKEGA